MKKGGYALARPPPVYPVCVAIRQVIFDLQLSGIVGYSSTGKTSFTKAMIAPWTM